MDGETLARAIREDERLRATRTILLTNPGAPLPRDTAYLNKPVRQQELPGVLVRALSEETIHVRTPDTQRRRREARPVFHDRNARILLAEDNSTNQEVALAILHKLGLAADAVANGYEVIHSLRTAHYDLVLMDVQMPEMDGLEATRQIRDPRSAVTNSGIPVIAMTARALEGDRDRCLAAGMNDYVSKPVEPKALETVLRKWLPERTDEGSRDSLVIWDRAGMLDRFLGDEELVATIMTEFLKDMPRQIEVLQDLLESGDVTGATRQAHVIKGMAANMGGEALQAAAREMERADSLDHIRARIGELVGAFEQLRDLMRP